MSQVILLGDSIFDNARYVPGRPSVIEHLRRCLPAGWRATLLAPDGAGSAEMARPFEQLPGDATHLIVSVGGNDALDYCGMLLHEPARSFADVLSQLAEIQERFRSDYRCMLGRVLAFSKPAAVCTVYDAAPGLDVVERTGLCLFNDVILREAFRARVPVIDLRLICTDSDDYSQSSPIEPSVVGGGKIARAVARLVTGYDFQGEGSWVFA